MIEKDITVNILSESLRAAWQIMDSNQRNRLGNEVQQYFDAVRDHQKLQDSDRFWYDLKGELDDLMS